VDIELLTTKKKLTKNILKQMPTLERLQFPVATPLGYIRCIFKQGTKHVLCRTSYGTYALLNALWEKRGNYAGYNIPGVRGEYIKRIPPSEIDDWFKDYNNLVRAADMIGQIYV
jgi:hypothetical protein